MKKRFLYCLLILLFFSSAGFALSKTKFKTLLDEYINPFSMWHQHRTASQFEQLGYSAVKYLLPLLKNKRYKHRADIAALLGVIKDKRAIPVLIVASKDSDSSVRAASVRAFWDFKDPRIIPIIIKAAKDPIVSVRKAAIHTLSQIKDKRVIPVLITALQDRDQGVRYTAVSNIDSFILGREAVNPLIRLLDEKCIYTRGYAATALAKIGDKRALPALLNVFMKLDENADSNRMCNDEIANAVGKLGQTDVIPFLFRNLKSKKEYHRRMSAQALKWVKDRGVVQPLLRALQDKSLLVRKNAAWALYGKVGIQAIPHLVRALKGSKGELLRTILITLGSIKDKQVVPYLIAGIKRVKGASKYWPVKLLGRYKDRRAIPLLISLLKNKDCFVRAAAAQALGRMKVVRAVPALIATLKDMDTVTAAVVWALGEIKDIRGLFTIMDAFVDWSPFVRKAALKAFKRFWRR